MSNFSMLTFNLRIVFHIINLYKQMQIFCFLIT